MSLVAVLLTPIVLLSSTAGAIEAHEWHDPPSAAVGDNPPSRHDAPPGATRRPADGWVFREVAESFRIQAQNQVRIEQHMSIRVAPLSRPVTAPPRFVLDLPQREIGPRFVERAMGRCLSVAGIAGVQPDAGSRLILYMRDRRMVSAVLERSCRARDFYSGFYIERTSDGQLCVDRDTLLSRSGANCKLTRIRQLIDADE